MHLFILRLIAVCACLFILAGCGSTARFQNIPDGAGMEVNVPQRTTLPRESLPAEMKLVCSAIINKIRGKEPTPHVRFYKKASLNTAQDDFNYDGFDVRRIDFTELDLKRTELDQSEGLVQGVFHFEDFVGRKSSLFFLAEFMASPHGITIHRSNIVQLPPSFPEVEAFYVPYEKFMAAKHTLDSYREFYAFALSSALTMEPTEEEKNAYTAYQNLSYWDKRDVEQQKEKMVVMVFCKDRLKDASRFEVAASRGSIKPKYLKMKGWPVVLYGAEFVPDNWSKPFDVMAFYVPEGHKQRYVVGRFTNQKSYASSL